MRHRTPKRAAQERLYAKLRAEFLATHPMCQWCGRQATEVHHKAGRVGLLLTDVSRWAALCREDHQYVTEHPAWAFEVGLSERRVGAA